MSSRDTKMAANGSNYTYDDLLRLNDERAITQIPTMVILSLLIVIGLVGNSLTCYIIGFRLQSNNQNLLIVWLAMFDLLSCLVVIPADIMTLRYSLTFPSGKACKVFHLVRTFILLGSFIVLCSIAIERYKKICRPLHRPMKRSDTKRALVFGILLAVILSLPAFIIFNIRSIESPLPGQKAQVCAISNELEGSIYVIMYDSTMCLTCVALSTILVTAYGLTLRAIKRHKRCLNQIGVADFRQCSRKISDMSIVMSSFPNQRNYAANIILNDSTTKTNRQSDILDGSLSTLCCMNEDQRDDRKETKGNETKSKSNQWPKIKNLFSALDTPVKIDSKGLTRAQFSLSSLMKAQLSSEPNTIRMVESNIKATSNVLISVKMNETSSKDTTDVPMPLKTLSRNTHVHTERHNLGNQRKTMDSNVSYCTQQPVAIRSLSKTFLNKTLSRSTNHVGKCIGRQKSQKLEAKLTKIAIVITVVFILSIIPSFCIKLFEMIQGEHSSCLHGILLVLYSVFYRSFYINSISNPIIYGVLNNRCRAEMKCIFLNLHCRQTLNEAS